jgi:hypothetical protein
MRKQAKAKVVSLVPVVIVTGASLLAFFVVLSMMMGMPGQA